VSGGARLRPLATVAALLAGVLALTAAATRPAPPISAREAARSQVSARGELVVLLHGLGRTRVSMGTLQEALTRDGYRVINLGYPSRDHPVEALADTLARSLRLCCQDEPGPIHFVTHSMGGIVVRAYRQRHGDPRMGRVVMLSPPNHGSEVVDRLPDPLLGMAMGPAALQLGTDTASVPRSLPPADFDLGIIVGDGSLNPLFSAWLPGADDGKVSVSSAWLEGADAFLVVPYSHTFIMRRAEVIEQVVAFLRTGAFLAPARPDA
jgi:triacylglycerol lipase